MQAFHAGKLTMEEVYDLLVVDFQADGKSNVQPPTTFYDAPPTGMGYSNELAMQNFLNHRVNSESGKSRYNLGPQTVIWAALVQPEKKVGYLASYITNQQQ